MDFFQNNMEVFRKRFPGLAEKVSKVDIDMVAAGRAQDEGIFYAVKNPEGKWGPITNHINPGANAQKGIDKMQHRLAGGLAPAVVIGLAPGYVLDSVYRHFKSRLSHHEPFRHIYVIADSIFCLVAWMKCTDRREILENPNVLFCGVDEVFRIVELCEQDEQRSHLFIPMTELDDVKAEKIILSLSELYLKREKEYKKWTEEVNDYYDSIDDKTLIEIISGNSGRKPRLLMPTHSSSTVVQYSTRDTCSAFEKLGWETKVLRMDRDLTKWRVAKEIREFRPDVLLFINHLRTEDDGVDLYPKNLMFITWIQDTMPAIHQHIAAEKWNRIATEEDKRTGQPRKRDILIGYTDAALSVGFLRDRAYEIGMIVNTSIFRKQELSEKDRKKYECEICFASHRGKVVESIIREDLAPVLSSCGIKEACLFEICDYLTERYRQGASFINYEELRKGVLHNVPSFADGWYALSSDDQNLTIQRIFWILNDIIYRNTVLEWCDELGVNLKIYGRDWDKNPRFSKYAAGELIHGSELSKAYQCAGFGLHLNSIEGTHQRPLEIIASGGVPVWRCRNKDYLIPPELASALRKTVLKLYGNEEVAYVCNEKEREELIHFLFFSLIFGNQKDFQTEKSLLMAAKLKIQTRLASSPDWLMPNIKQQTFTDKKDFERILKSRNVKIPYGYLISKVNDISVAERIKDFILSFLGSEGDSESTAVFESKVNDVLNFRLQDTLDFIKAIAHSKISIISEKAVQPHITPVLKLFAAEKLLANKQIESAGNIAKTISPDAIPNKDILKKLFYVLQQTKRDEQAVEVAGKLTAPEDLLWMAETYIKSGDIGKAASIAVTLGKQFTKKEDLLRLFSIVTKCGIKGMMEDMIPRVSGIAQAFDFAEVYIANGYIAEALDIIRKIPAEPLNSAFESGRLAKNLLFCGLPEEAINLFNKNERLFKNNQWTEHYFWKAYAFSAICDYEQSLINIDNDINVNGIRFGSTFLHSSLFWHSGDLDNAVTALYPYMKKTELEPYEKLYFNLMMAKICRERGEMEKALNFLAEMPADFCYSETVFKYFETALTLLHLGRNEEALKAVETGSAYNFVYNVNPVFKIFIENKIGKDQPQHLELAETASKLFSKFTCSWPPMKPWLKFMEALSWDNAGETDKAKNIIIEFLKNPVCMKKSICFNIISLIQNGTDWRSEECTAKTAEAFFPNLFEGSFSRQWIKNEYLRKH